MKIQERTQTAAAAAAHGHPTTTTFLKVGAVLAVLTAVEFGIIYLTGFKALVVAVLFILSIAKFILVAGYFMHLKFDGQLLRWTFTVGALLAVGITIAQIFINRA